MALIKVHDELIDNKEVFRCLESSFDSMVKVGHDCQCLVTTFRVQHEEIPKEDKLIAPEMVGWSGIKPFIIDFGV